MALYLFDFGKFENLSLSLRRSNQRQWNANFDLNSSSEIQLNSETPSKDEEMDDIALSLTSNCQDHERKTSNFVRRTSDQQLSKIKSVAKSKKERNPSVVGEPHRHNITIAVNDEPVDIIKTTCTGQCSHLCQSNSRIKTKPTSGFMDHNSQHLNSEFQNSNQSTILILVTMTYVISAISIRSLINLYSSVNMKIINNHKKTLSLLYFFTAILTLLTSLNYFSNSNKVLPILFQMLISLFIIIIWLGLHLTSTSSWSLFLLSVVLFSSGITLFWDSKLRMISNLDFSFCYEAKINDVNHISSKANVILITSVIGHSLYIWSSILIFIIFETLSSYEIEKPMGNSLKIENKDNHNRMENNQSNICGINVTDQFIGINWKVPDITQSILIYICIGFNVISLILVIILFNKSKTLRISQRSINAQDISHSRGCENLTSNHLLNEESWTMKIKNGACTWIKSNSKIILKMWKCQHFKYIIPNIFTVGLVEGFFVTDYNQNFINCYKDPRFIGISMLMFSLAPIGFVNLIPLIIKHKIVEIISGIICRAILLSSILLLILTEIGKHWSYLIIFFPWMVSLDSLVSLSLFYISASSLPKSLWDSSVVAQRVIRMLGISTYTFISGVFGTYTASMVTMLIHIFISPLFFLLGTLVKCSKN